jgi:cyclic pyranopterin phosphate synthase
VTARPEVVTLRLGRPARRDDTPATMPLEGPLVDRFGRVHRDLRLSITDRCNFRCTYCMPEEGITFLPRAEILSAAEVLRVAGVLRPLGVESVRLTGGEPLLRRDVVEIVAGLSALGFSDRALTTNGSSLERLAPALREAGLSRINVSCDSLRPERFAAIRRRGRLDNLLRSMDAAEAVGFSPLKVNVVLIRGTNDDEILDFARFARERGRVVRFIEYMPLDAEHGWRRSEVVPGAEVVERINEVFPLVSLGAPDDPAPATRFAFADGHGEIGIISSVTEPFCGTCDRLRLTAEGAIRNCLFSDDEGGVRSILRTGGSDEQLALAFRESLWGKLPGHGINDPGFLQPRRSMSMIGG